jgi:hypothetical protein
MKKKYKKISKKLTALTWRRAGVVGAAVESVSSFVVFFVFFVFMRVLLLYLHAHVMSARVLHAYCTSLARGLVSGAHWLVV